MASPPAAPPAAGADVRQRSVARGPSSKDAAAPPPAGAAPQAPAQSPAAGRTDGSVWRTFSLFSVAMFALPIAALYGSKDTVFGGNINYAGGLAAVVANLVLAAYVVVCFRDGEGPASAPAPAKEQGKDQ